MALWGNQWVIGFYTNNDNLVRLAFYPFIVMLLNYLYLLSECFHASLTVYMTAEYLFVILLGIQSIIYLKRKSN